MNNEINNQNFQNNQSMNNNVDNLLNNNKKKANKKNILIVVAVSVVLLGTITLLSKSSDNNINSDNNQNLINDNKVENNVGEEQTNNNAENQDVVENEEVTKNEDTNSQNSDIIKKTLGQTSTFDNGISIKVIDSIEYIANDSFYHKPRFIKIEISNNSNKNFYQRKEIYSYYSGFTENPIEFIQEDFDYTKFDIQPIYSVGDEIKTERSGCVLRKYASLENTISDDQGGVSDVNYVALRPGEQTTAYFLCYFREEIADAKIKAILIYNNKNNFMYFMN